MIEYQTYRKSCYQISILLLFSSLPLSIYTAHSKQTNEMKNLKCSQSNSNTNEWYQEFGQFDEKRPDLRIVENKKRKTLIYCDENKIKKIK